MSKNRRAFTLVELMVALLISSILISVTASIYVLIRKSIALDQNRSDIGQNARISMDRITRDLRQTREVVTVLPTSPTDLSVTQPGQILFEDGHPATTDSDYLTYRNYYLTPSGVLNLDIDYYYVSPDTTTRVHWTTPNATLAVISTVAIAEHVGSLSFYNNAGAIKVVVTTTDGTSQNYTLKTTVVKRN
jgi:prepilin-type N-terminal cleavage/methylation domain-containing protein